MIVNARKLQREERALWERLRHIRPRFTRQLRVGSYVLHFACRTLKIAVALDGGQHLDAVAYDGKRTEFLERARLDGIAVP